MGILLSLPIDSALAAGTGDSLVPPIFLAQDTEGDSSIETAPLPPISDPQPSPPIDASASEPVDDEAVSDDQNQDANLDELEPEGSVETISSDIRAHTLGAIPGEGVGEIDDKNGGLGGRLWQGSNPGVLSALLPRLPAPVREPVLRSLQLRLLLTRAAGPGALGQLDPLVPLRAERLHAMGFDQGAMKLVSGQPAQYSVDPQEEFEKAILAEKWETACDLVRSSVTESGDPYWKMALIYCQIKAGQTEQATLGLDLMREFSSDQASADFIGLADILLNQGSPGKLRLREKPDALRAAMMKLAGIPVTEIQGLAPHRPSGPAKHAASARNVGLPILERAKHAERAFEIGLIDASELAAIYRLVPMAGNPMTAPNSLKTRARLFQISESTPDSTQRAKAVEKLATMARQSANYSSMAPLYALSIARIPVNGDLGWFSPEAFRILMLAGNRDLASFWLNLAEGARRAPIATQAVPGMEILAQWSGIAGRYDPDPVEIWRATNNANSAMAGKMYGIYRALGQPIATAGADSLIGLGLGRREFQDAVSAGRRGETVLRALVLLGEKGLAEADTAALVQSIGALTAVGLESDARAIAIAAGIAAGL